MKKGKILAGVTSLALVAAISVGATLAYMTGKDVKTNTFTVGNVSIALQETSWDAANSHVIAPNTSLAKDPVVVNTGANEAWVRIKLTYNPAVISLEGLDSKWVKDGDFYYYNAPIMNKDAANADKSTSALFTGIKMLNLNNSTLGALTAADEDVKVEAYAIQADGVTTLDQAKAAFADPSNEW